MSRRLPVAAVLILAVAACKRSGPVAEAVMKGSDEAEVSLEKAEAHAEPSGKSPVVATLARGDRLGVRGAQDGFFKVALPSGKEGWLASGSFERLSDKQAREHRAKAVGAFTPQPARAVESCPVFLAPDYGAARWGEVDDGLDLQVLVADHEFYGIKNGTSLAFLPARCVRLLPSEVTASAAPVGPVEKGRRRPAEVVPSIQSDAPPESEPEPVAPGEAPAEAPVFSMPSGSEPPQVLRSVEPQYPEAARRLGIAGLVILRAHVEPDGSVSRVDVVQPAHPMLTEVSIEAVRRWQFRPATDDGRPIPATHQVRFRFDPRSGR